MAQGERRPPRKKKLVPLTLEELTCKHPEEFRYVEVDGKTYCSVCKECLTE